MKYGGGEVTMLDFIGLNLSPLSYGMSSPIARMLNPCKENPRETFHLTQTKSTHISSVAFR